MPRSSFKIDSCPPEEGDGWFLRYFEDDCEIPGQELFTAMTDAPDILQEEYDNARITGELWLDELTKHKREASPQLSKQSADTAQLKFLLE